jgi:hypothetical protein
MAYAELDDDSYYVSWCDRCGKKCSEVWPKDCPHAQRETRYAEAVEAHKARYRMGVKEYYAWCAKTVKRADRIEAAAYA